MRTPFCTILLCVHARLDFGHECSMRALISMSIAKAEQPMASVMPTCRKSIQVLDITLCQNLHLVDNLQQTRPQQLMSTELSKRHLAKHDVTICNVNWDSSHDSRHKLMLTHGHDSRVLKLTKMMRLPSLTASKCCGEEHKGVTGGGNDEETEEGASKRQRTKQTACASG